MRDEVHLARVRSLARFPTVAFAAFLGASGADGPRMQAPPTAASVEPAYRAFGPPERVEIVGYDGDAMEPFLTRDGCCLMFNDRNDPAVDTELHWARRVDDLTFRYEGTIPGTSSPRLDAVATMDLDHHFYFVSDRDYFSTLSTIYQGRWEGGEVKEIGALAGVSRHQPGWVNSASSRALVATSSQVDDRRLSYKAPARATHR